MQHTYDEAQEGFIRDNAKDFTARELATALGLGIHHIYIVGRKYRLNFKLPTFRKPRESKPVERPAPKVTARPAAIYNQSPSPYGIASKERIL